MTGIIGVSASRNARYSAFTECLANLDKPQDTWTVVKTGIDIATNRRDIVRDALAEDHVEWVLFLDDDMVFGEDHLRQLLDHDLWIVASLYLNRTPPYYAMAFNERTIDNDGRPAWKPISLDGAPEEGLSEVVAAGTGGMLVRREVFEEVEYDTWFAHSYERSTDDIAFCERVTEAGFKIWLDLGSPMGHISIHEVWPRRDEEWHVGLQLSEKEELKVKLAP
jgi:GT2 family glycosyltransferase